MTVKLCYAAEEYTLLCDKCREELDIEEYCNTDDVCVCDNCQRFEK